MNPGNSENLLNSQTFGINLIGSLTGNMGLGVTARAIANLLKIKDIPFSIYNIDYDWGSRINDFPFKESYVGKIEDLKHPINLYVLPIMMLQSIFTTHPEFAKTKRMHIANIWWEASHVPASWLSSLNLFDGMLSMSHFITEICRNQLTLTPVISGEHPLNLPTNISNNRSDFSLTNDDVVFVASMDINSDPARKNPGAIIRSFRHSFGLDDKNARLLLRLNNANTDLGRMAVQRMRNIAGDDERITLLVEPMSYSQILSLYNCADVYLSFHRSEGLGLGMLESMALGKAVVATGWSGNLSFMNNSNSALLRYKLIPVSGTYNFFKSEFIGQDAKWADPALEDAVAWMRELRHNKTLRESLGAKAKFSADEYQARANSGNWIDELRNFWQNQRHIPAALSKI